MVVYNIILICLIFLSLFFSKVNIVINAASMVSVALILVTVLQVAIFKYYINDDKESNTAYTAREIDHDMYKRSLIWHYRCKLAVFPIYFFTVFYLDSVWKIILPIMMYVCSYFPVRFLSNHFDPR